jgi:hypothetical protein
MPDDDLPDLKATGKVNGGGEVTYLQPYVGGKDAEVEGKERPNTASKGVQADEDPLLPFGQGGRIAVSTRLLEQTGFECFRLSNLLRRLPLDLCDLSASSPLLRGNLSINSALGDLELRALSFKLHVELLVFVISKTLEDHTEKASGASAKDAGDDGC